MTSNVYAQNTIINTRNVSYKIYLVQKMHYADIYNVKLLLFSCWADNGINR